MLKGFLTPAWTKQKPQGYVKGDLHVSQASVHARHALKSHCSEKLQFTEACVWQVEGHHQQVDQVSPMEDSHPGQADLSWLFPTNSPSKFQACPGSSKAHTLQLSTSASSPTLAFPCFPSLQILTASPFPHAELALCAFTSLEQAIWNKGAVLQ